MAGLLAGLSIALYGVRRSAAAEVLQIPCLVLEVPLPSAGGKTQVVGSFRRPLEHRPIKAAVLPAKSTIARGSAGNLCDLAQKIGNDASRTLYKPDCGQCEKRKWSRGLRGEGTV